VKLPTIATLYTTYQLRKKGTHPSFSLGRPILSLGSSSATALEWGAGEVAHGGRSAGEVARDGWRDSDWGAVGGAARQVGAAAMWRAAGVGLVRRGALSGTPATGAPWVRRGGGDVACGGCGTGEEGRIAWGAGDWGSVTVAGWRQGGMRQMRTWRGGAHWVGHGGGLGPTPGRAWAAAAR